MSKDNDKELKELKNIHENMKYLKEAADNWLVGLFSIIGFVIGIVIARHYTIFPDSILSLQLIRWFIGFFFVVGICSLVGTGIGLFLQEFTKTLAIQRINFDGSEIENFYLKSISMFTIGILIYLYLFWVRMTPNDYGVMLSLSSNSHMMWVLKYIRFDGIKLAGIIFVALQTLFIFSWVLVNRRFTTYFYRNDINGSTVPMYLILIVLLMTFQPRILWYIMFIPFISATYLMLKDIIEYESN